MAISQTLAAERNTSLRAFSICRTAVDTIVRAPCSTRARHACRGAASRFEVGQHVRGQWCIEVVRHRALRLERSPPQAGVNTDRVSLRQVSPKISLAHDTVNMHDAKTHFSRLIFITVMRDAPDT